MLNDGSGLIQTVAGLYTDLKASKTDCQRQYKCCYALPCNALSTKMEVRGIETGLRTESLHRVYGW